MGGKYGTNLAVNFSQVNSVETTPTANFEKYESEYLAIGDQLYYRDLNVKIHKKINNKWKADLNYLNLKFNNNILKLIQDESGSSTFGMLEANIVIVDVSYKIKPRQTIRMELQGLFTEQDTGDGAGGLFPIVCGITCKKCINWRW